MFGQSSCQRAAFFVQRYLFADQWRERVIREYIDDFQPTSGVDVDDCLSPRYLARGELIWELSLAPGIHSHLHNDLERLLGKVVVRHEDERQIEKLSILDFDGVGATKAYHTYEGRRPIRHLQHLALDLPPGSRWYKFATAADAQEMLSQLVGQTVLGPVPEVHRQRWNGRLDLDNSDGSHRFASILRFCLDHGTEVSFDCSVETICVDAEVIQQMLTRWHLLIVAHRTRVSLFTALESNDPYRRNPWCYPEQEPALEAGFNRRRQGGVNTCIYAVPRSWPHADHLHGSMVRRGPSYAFDLSRALRQIVAAQKGPPLHRIKPKGVPGPIGYGSAQ